MSKIRVGISGWTYPMWRKTFYPKGLPAKRELEFASERFGTIEVNGSFYRLQKPATFRDWYERTPEHLVFSVKGNRYITHTKRLKDARAPLANFFASGVLELKEKLGPILWQLPPRTKFDAGRLREFLEQLPMTVKEAVMLARSHDIQIEGDDEPLVARSRAMLRHAIEIRDDSFKCDAFIDLLREFGVAYVIADTSERWVYAEDLTADFVYVRLHGFKELYKGGYPEEAIEAWAEKIKRWSKGRPSPDPRLISAETMKPEAKDVFVYFDNDAKVNAPFDASALMTKLKRHPGLILPSEPPERTLERRAVLSNKTLTALQDRALNR